jgi:hypothetical protein
MLLKDRFVRELGRQFRLDLGDDEARRQREGVQRSVQESTGGLDGTTPEDTFEVNQSLENGEKVSAEELFIGHGQKRRTWITAPPNSLQEEVLKVPAEKANLPKEVLSQLETGPKPLKS